MGIIILKPRRFGSPKRISLFHSHKEFKVNNSLFVVISAFICVLMEFITIHAMIENPEITGLEYFIYGISAAFLMLMLAILTRMLLFIFEGDIRDWEW